MSIVQKLKNIEKKYEKLLQMEDDEDLKFIINELHSKFKLKQKDKIRIFYVNSN